MNSNKSKLIIGTRSSKLALWQTNFVKENLEKFFPDIEVTIKEIKTKGDQITDISLSKIEGKGFFTKEIEDALLNNEIDLAVHSLKDLPTKLPGGLKISAVLNREDPCDVLILRNERGYGSMGETAKRAFNNLKEGSKVGTSSLRRISQLKAIRDDLEYLELRGNVDTRIRKLQEGQYDAIVLAYAGVKRLGFENLISEKFNPKEILPAVCQGILAIESRENDNDTESTIMKLNDEKAYLISIAEREFLSTLQGGCQIPVGAYSEIIENKITLYGVIASLDGKKIIRDKITGNLNEAKEIGIKLAQMLLQNGGRKILENIMPIRQNTSLFNV